MAIFILSWQFVIWYYTAALFNFIKISRDFIWFLFHFFSIPILIPTLFSKWKRIGDVRTKKFNIADFFSVLIVNSIMRIVGFFIRSFVVITGFVSIVLAIAAEIAVFIAWLFLPVIIVALFVLGMKLMVGLD
ncbi:MAG: hypothetical protein HZB09_02580 [Candidatus Yonathbacteria bacterium]|nr:hypothetical protein [Candidatus Yonathbacteria bacterium]